MKLEQIGCIFNELHVLKELSGSNTAIELYWALQDDAYVYLVTEFMEGGDLKTQISARRNVQTDEFARFYAAEILLAIKFMHSRKIFHGDIKPSNVLLHPDGHSRLADFGVSSPGIPTGEIIIGSVGTRAYWAPELRGDEARSRYTNNIDWYALGVLLYHMLVGRREFDEFFQHQIDRAARGRPRQELPIYRWMNEYAAQLVCGLTAYDTRQRISSQDAENHPFFTKASAANEGCAGFCSNVKRMKPPRKPKNRNNPTMQDLTGLESLSPDELSQIRSKEEKYKGFHYETKHPPPKL